MLVTGVKGEKYAIGFFGYKCPPEWAHPRTGLIGSVLRDGGEHLKVRSAASYALCWHGEPAHEFYSDMLKLVMEDKPGDPFGLIDSCCPLRVWRMSGIESEGGRKAT